MGSSWLPSSCCWLLSCYSNSAEGNQRCLAGGGPAFVESHSPPFPNSPPACSTREAWCLAVKTQSLACSAGVLDHFDVSFQGRDKRLFRIRDPQKASDSRLQSRCWGAKLGFIFLLSVAHQNSRIILRSIQPSLGSFQWLLQNSPRATAHRSGTVA